MRKTIMKSTERMLGTVKGSVYMSAVLQRGELRAAVDEIRAARRAAGRDGKIRP